MLAGVSGWVGWCSAERTAIIDAAAWHCSTAARRALERAAIAAAVASGAVRTGKKSLRKAAVPIDTMPRASGVKVRVTIRMKISSEGCPSTDAPWRAKSRLAQRAGAAPVSLNFKPMIKKRIGVCAFASWSIAVDSGWDGGWEA